MHPTGNSPHEVGWGRGYFLCGCKQGPRKGYNGRWIGREVGRNVKGEEIVLVVGEAVCPMHGARAYGWRPGMKDHRSGLVATALRGSAVDERDLQDPEKLGEMILEEKAEWAWDTETSPLHEIHDDMRLRGRKAPPFDG